MMTWMHDEGHGAPVDLAGGDRRDQLAGDLVEIGLGRRDAAQVEQREAERRVHERGLHVDAEQHAEPDQVDAELVRHRAEQRHDDEGQLEEVEEEGEEEDQDVDHDQEADLAAGQAGQQVLDPESPLTPWKVRLNTREPIRMKITKEDSLAVEFIAWLSSDQLSRRLASARTSAPVAPMAPPSVGVAMPRKIVPSTRKISASGGISTNDHLLGQPRQQAELQ